MGADGMRVAGVLVGVDAWVKTFVAKKARSVISDVAKLDVVSDGLLHNQCSHRKTIHIIASLQGYRFTMPPVAALPLDFVLVFAF